MDDAALARATSDAERVERDVRRHMAVETGAFEQSHAVAAYRHAVALRKALEKWAVTREKLAAR